MRRRKFAPGQQLATSPVTSAMSSSAWDFRRSKRWPVSTRTICENRKSPSVSRSCCFGASLGSSATRGGGSAQHPAPTKAIATAPTARATDNASGGGDDDLVRQLREQLSALQQTAPPNATAAAGCPPTTTTQPPCMLSWQNPQVHLQNVSATGAHLDITDFVVTCLAKRTK